jgi:hypothetical protein
LVRPFLFLWHWTAPEFNGIASASKADGDGQDHLRLFPQPVQPAKVIARKILSAGFDAEINTLSLQGFYSDPILPMR